MTACTGQCQPFVSSEESASVGHILDVLLDQPSRHLVMLGEPYAALALEIIQRPAKHCRHQRSPAKMAVDPEVEQGAGLAGVEILERVLGPAIDRRDPAGRSAAGRILQDVERLLDGLALAVCSHRKQGLVLQVAVAGNVMAGAGKGGDRLRPELGAAPVTAVDGS